MSRRTILVSVSIVLAVLISGVSLLAVYSYLLSEPSVSLKVSGGNPPAFVLSGSDEMRSLLIDTCVDKGARPLWKIEYAGSGKAKKAKEVGRIVYGVLPDGFRQVIPEGTMAPPLIPDQEYAFHVGGYFTNPGRAFKIRNGEAIEIPTIPCEE